MSISLFLLSYLNVTGVIVNEASFNINLYPFISFLYCLYCITPKTAPAIKITQETAIIIFLVKPFKLENSPRTPVSSNVFFSLA